MRYSLVIKGDPGVAAIELASRGLQAQPPGFALTRCGEVVVRVNAEPRTLQRWFGEAYTGPLAQPAPAGTLLLFTLLPELEPPDLVA